MDEMEILYIYLYLDNWWNNKNAISYVEISRLVKYLIIIIINNSESKACMYNFTFDWNNWKLLWGWCLNIVLEFFFMIRVE